MTSDMKDSFRGFAALAALAVSFSTGCAIGPANTPTENTVFMMPQASIGDLGGLAGADQMCNDVATTSGLPGTYVACLSTSTTNAIDRVTGDGPWFNTRYSETGEIEVFASHADLAAGNIETEIAAPGGKLQAEYAAGVWTGTTNHGQSTGLDCAGWTSAGLDPTPGEKGTIGAFSLDNPDWKVTWSQMTTTDPGNPPTGPSACSEAMHIYCFEN